MTIARTCEWCRTGYDAPTLMQRFCSRRCAGLHRHRARPAARSSPRPPWVNRPPVDREHRRMRARLLPAAIGTVCPLRASPNCTGIMTDPSRMQLDHIIPRALGGRTTADNTRVVCAPCNHYLGSKLGGATTTSRRHRTARPAPPPHRTLPQW